MRMLMLFAAWSVSFLSPAHAQLPRDDLTGTYALETQRGLMVVRIEVSGGRLAGTLDVPGTSTIALRGDALGRYARGAISSAVDVDTGEFEALVEGDTLALKLSYKAETVPLRLQRVATSTAAPPPGAPGPPGKGPAPSPGPPVQTAGDPRLVGTWVSQSMISSGDASMASEQFLVFHADGTYVYGTGRAVAGGSSWSYEGGGGATERGRWRTENGIYYISTQDGEWKRVGKYGMTEDGRTMMITNDRGGKKIWNRSR
jgi:hypothetical protein